MRFDVSNLGQLDRALHDYSAAATPEPLILVLHTPGEIAFRFIVNQHGIVRQGCDRRGDARSDL
jgi:hypothetical protein